VQGGSRGPIPNKDDVDFDIFGDCGIMPNRTNFGHELPVHDPAADESDDADNSLFLTYLVSTHLKPGLTRAATTRTWRPHTPPAMSCNLSCILCW
jgi:hypothetical protein